MRGNFFGNDTVYLGFLLSILVWILWTQDDITFDNEKTFLVVIFHAKGVRCPYDLCSIFPNFILDNQMFIRQKSLLCLKFVSHVQAFVHYSPIFAPYICNVRTNTIGSLGVRPTRNRMVCCSSNIHYCVLRSSHMFKLLSMPVRCSSNPCRNVRTNTLCFLGVRPKERERGRLLFVQHSQLCLEFDWS